MWLICIICFLIHPGFGFLVLLSWAFVALVKKLYVYGTPTPTNKESKNDTSENAERFFEVAKGIKERGQIEKNEQDEEKNLDQVAAGYLFSSPRFGRVTFKNVVLDSPKGNTAHTEIDEIVVSPYGIFCLEYKSHKGYIFGSKDRSTWTQCTYSGKYPFHNPLYQNYKHVKGIEHLLGGAIKAPIHSYVVFTDAAKVSVDSNDVFDSYYNMVYRISLHNKQIYTLEEYENILTKLAHASTKSADLLSIHIGEVNTYLSSIAA